jgi:hypothetical protein
MVNLIGAALACPQRFGCGWVDRLKHRPHPGLTRGHTTNGNAKYLPGTTPAQIQGLETETVTAPTVVLSPAPAAEYVRDAPHVIGYANGQDTTLSYVECTSRFFHGRPIAPADRKLRGVQWPP